MPLRWSPGWKELARVGSQNCGPLLQASSVTRLPSWLPSRTNGVKDRWKGRSSDSNSSNVKPMGEPGLICYDIESCLALHELCPEDDGEPDFWVHHKSLDRLSYYYG